MPGKKKKKKVCYFDPFYRWETSSELGRSLASAGQRQRQPREAELFPVPSVGASQPYPLPTNLGVSGASDPGGLWASEE